MLFPREAAGAEIARGLVHNSIIRAAVAALAGAAASWSGSAHGQATRYETVIQAPRARDDAPTEDEAASASVVTDDRAPRAAESLPQILSELPGAHVTRLGGLGSLATVSLRGSTAEQVLIYVDGIPLNTAWGGGVDLSTVPLADVERVEVYRGMTPVAFGESALGGVVSVTTRTPRGSGGAVELGGGFFGTRFGGASGSWAGRHARVYGGAHMTASDGDFSYRNDNGTLVGPGSGDDDTVLSRRNNAMGQADGVVRVVTPLSGRRELAMSFLGFSRRQGLPGDGTTPTTLASLVTRRALVAAAYQSRDDLGGSARLRALGWGSLLDLRLSDPAHEVAPIATESRDRSQAAGATVTATGAVGERLRLSGTLDGRGEWFRPSEQAGAPTEGQGADRAGGAAAAEADLWLRAAHLDVVPSARIEFARDVRAGRDSFYRMRPAGDPVMHVIPVARLGLVQRPSATVALRANVGRYARMPSFAELYANSGTAHGNPDLAAETGVNADVGVVVDRADDAGRLRGEATVFASRVRDLISWQIRSRGVAAAENVDSAQVLGAEASLLAETPRRLRVVAQCTFTDARDVGDVPAYRGKQIPLRPRWRAYARPEIRRIRLPAAVEMGLHADVDATAGNTLDRVGLSELPARLLFGMGATLGRSDGAARVIVSAANILDVPINDLLGYPLPGRSVFLTLVVATPNQEIP